MVRKEGLVEGCQAIVFFHSMIIKVKYDNNKFEKYNVPITILGSMSNYV